MMNSSESFLEYASEMSREYFIERNYENGSYKENNEELRRIHNLIAEIDTIKQNNPNMDISEFINERFGEEKGKELFKKYLACAEITKYKINDLKLNVETFKTNVIGKINTYLEEVDKIKKTLESKQISEILEVDPANYRLGGIQHYKILDREKFNELRELNGQLDALERKVNDCEKDAIYRIKHDIFNNQEKEQIDKLYKQFTDDERILITALLIAQPENKEFFENYRNKYLSKKKAAIFDIDEKCDSLTYKIDSMEDEPLKSLPVERITNVSLGKIFSEEKYGKAFSDILSTVKKEYTPESLSKMTDIQKLVKIIEHDTSHLISKDEFREISSTMNYGELLSEVRYQEIYDKVSKFIPVTANTFIKYLLKKDTRYRDYHNYYDANHYINGSKYYTIKQDCCLEFDLKYDQDNNKTILTLFLDTYDYADKTCSNIKRHKLGEYSCQGNQSIDSVIKSSKEAQNIINDINIYNSLKTSELLDFLRKKRIKNIINKQYGYNKYVKIINYSVNNDSMTNGIFEKGIAMINNKIIYFEDFDDNEGKESLRIVENIKFRKPIEEECKICLEDKDFLINKVQNLAELTDEAKLDLINKIDLNTLDENDKLFLMNRIKSDISNKINSAINKTGEDKIKIDIDALDKINELTIYELLKINRLDLSKLDKTTKLALMEKINSTKLDETFKENLINKIKNSNELTEEDKIDLTNLIHSNKLNGMHKLTSVKEIDEHLSIALCNFSQDRREVVNKIKLSILTDCQKWKEDQGYSSIFDFEEIFGNMTQEDRDGRIIPSLTPRIQCVAGNEEREKAILKEVTTFYANEETMKSTHLEDIEGASKEMEQSFQTGRVVDKK